MKNLLRKVMYAVFGSPVDPGHGERSVRWTKSYEHATELMWTDPAAAEAPAREALEFAENSFGIGNWRIFDSMETLLKILCFVRKTDESEELCDRLVELTTHYYGEDNDKTANLLARLPRLFMDNGNLEKADKLYRKAFHALKKQYGPNNLELISMLFAFAGLSSNLGRPKAERWALRKLINHARRKGLIKTEWKMEVLLATSFAIGGNFGMAEELSETLPDKIKLPCDKQDFDIAIELPRLAAVLSSSGRFKEAEDLYELNIRVVKSFNKNRDLPVLISGLNGLARLYYETERLDESEILLRRVHTIIAKSFLSEDKGGDLFSEDELLQFLDARGRSSESEELLLDVKKRCEGIFGRNSVKMYIILYQLGRLYLNHGKLDDAEECYSESLETAKEHIEPGSPDVIYIMAELGKTMLIKSQFREADRYLSKAVNLHDDSGREEGPVLADILNNLGKAAHAVGNYSNAELYCSRQLAILEKHLSPDNPALMPALSGLGWTLQSMHRYNEAEKVYKRLLEIQRKAESGSEQKSWEIAATLKMISDVLMEQNKHPDAEMMYSRALDIFKRTETDESGWVAGCLEGIARIRIEAGSVREGEVYLERAIKIYEKTGSLPPDRLDYLKNVLAQLRIRLSGTTAGLDEGSDDDSGKAIN